ncbi:hypothetical protein [Fredinandcohnia sp. 179-A 10B2 NHS]|uniref:hypothetical protein n=1 Tax=Fredinandcohnia sp. 179-A 10B2 NHS TaxID=3235176 RepID=UPI00399FFD47
MKNTVIKLNIYLLVLVTILTGCGSDSPSDLYSSLEGELSKEDQVNFDSLRSHVQKFIQLNNELTMLLEEMKNNDELEAAIDTMDIANQEALYIYNLIELDSTPENKTLRLVKQQIQKSIEEYMKAMTTQLEGISSGNTKKTDTGYHEAQKIVEEINEFYKQTNHP